VELLENAEIKQQMCLTPNFMETDLKGFLDSTSYVPQELLENISRPYTSKTAYRIVKTRDGRSDVQLNFVQPLDTFVRLAEPCDKKASEISSRTFVDGHLIAATKAKIDNMYSRHHIPHSYAKEERKRKLKEGHLFTSSEKALFEGYIKQAETNLMIQQRSHPIQAVRHCRKHLAEMLHPSLAPSQISQLDPLEGLYYKYRYAVI
jgi:hypothetical protein